MTLSAWMDRFAGRFTLVDSATVVPALNRRVAPAVTAAFAAASRFAESFVVPFATTP